MKDRLFPIGSVVAYKNVDLMIIGYLPKGEDKETHKEVCKDYLCCLYPIGVKDDQHYMLNHEEIDRIKFIGFQTPLEKKVIEQITKVSKLQKSGMTEDEIIEQLKKDKDET